MILHPFSRLKASISGKIAAVLVSLSIMPPMVSKPASAISPCYITTLCLVANDNGARGGNGSKCADEREAVYRRLTPMIKLSHPYATVAKVDIVVTSLVFGGFHAEITIQTVR